MFLRRVRTSFQHFDEVRDFIIGNRTADISIGARRRNNLFAIAAENDHPRHPAGSTFNQFVHHLLTALHLVSRNFDEVKIFNEQFAVLVEKLLELSAPASPLGTKMDEQIAVG